MVTSGEGRTDYIEMMEWETQTTGYKIGSKMYCTTQGILPIFCNSCKWDVTIKKLYIKIEIIFLMYALKHEKIR